MISSIHILPKVKCTLPLLLSYKYLLRIKSQEGWRIVCHTFSCKSLITNWTSPGRITNTVLIEVLDSFLRIEQAWHFVCIKWVDCVLFDYRYKEIKGNTIFPTYLHRFLRLCKVRTTGVTYKNDTDVKWNRGDYIIWSSVSFFILYLYKFLIT